MEAKYDAEIAAAQGNAQEVERLETEKAQKKLEIEKKYADVQFAVKASQIIADTAVAIMKALSQLGPIAGPVAAALMGVTGAAQLAAANAERQKVKSMTLSGASGSTPVSAERVVNASGGYDQGGYTGDGDRYGATSTRLRIYRRVQRNHLQEQTNNTTSMALTIQTEKGIFDLPRDFSVEIENTSPIYTDKGSQTIASTLPATGHNLSMVDYIHRPDIRNAPKRDAAAVVTDGVYRRTGKLNITSVSTESGIVCNIGFDESLMYEAWKNVSLKELPGLPVIKYPEGVAALARHLEEVMRYQTPADYHVFRMPPITSSARWSCSTIWRTPLSPERSTTGI